MIVRYVRERVYKGGGKDPHLTLGKEYLVLSATVNTENNRYTICLKSDLDKEPGVWDLKYFDVADPRIPEFWCFSQYGNGYYSLDPQEFTGDFWNWCNDGTKEEGEYARRILANVIIKIKRFHDRWDL